MIECTSHGDVTRIRMWTWRTTASGYDVSAYLVRGILVDTGFRHVQGELTRMLRERRPRGVIVTHWHEDHAGNASSLAAAGMPMWIAPATEAQLRARPQVKPYRHFTWGRPERLDAVLVPLDTAPLQIVAAPGHSDDLHVVFDPDTRTLVSADLWLGVKVRIYAESEDPYRIVESLTRVIALEPTRMFDAHRGLVTDPVASLAAKRDWLEDTIGAIERRLDAGDSERAILDAVLGGEDRSVHLITQGEYSRRNLIRAIARNRR